VSAGAGGWGGGPGARVDVLRSPGVALRFARDPVGAFSWLHEAHGPAVTVALGRRRLVSTARPADAQRVLKDNHLNYGKGAQYSSLDDVWGTSNLFASHGDDWARQRRVCGPDFAPARAADCHDALVRHAGALLDALEPRARSGELGPVYDELRLLMMRVYFEAWLGPTDARDLDAMSALLGEVDDVLESRVLAPKALSRLPTRGNARYWRAVAALRDGVDGLVRRHRARAEAEGNLLGHLLAATAADEPRRRLSGEELRGNLIAFLRAAYETPSFGWTLYFVGRRPDVRRALRDEAASALGGRAPGPGDLKALAYTRACVDEGLRMFTVAPLAIRRALAADSLGGLPVEPGDYVIIPAGYMHQAPELWTDPHEFRPERFLSPSHHPYSYLPFGRGARECVGRSLVLHSCVVILAMLLQRYDYELAPGYRARPTHKLRPYPVGKLPVRLRRWPAAGAEQPPGPPAPPAPWTPSTSAS
jgi:enediyne biosynthesis protein E7